MKTIFRTDSPGSIAYGGIAVDRPDLNVPPDLSSAATPAPKTVKLASLTDAQLFALSAGHGKHAVAAARTLIARKAARTQVAA